METTTHEEKKQCRCGEIVEPSQEGMENLDQGTTITQELVILSIETTDSNRDVKMDVETLGDQDIETLRRKYAETPGDEGVETPRGKDDEDSRYKYAQTPRDEVQHNEE
jgi:hypothetical protein